MSLISILYFSLIQRLDNCNKHGYFRWFVSVCVCVRVCLDRSFPFNYLIFHKTNLMIFGYSLSLPWESRHLRYITDASTLAGEYVFGSFSREITDNKIVRTFCVGFHLSHGNSPLCGSSTGGCNIEIHRSPFYKIKSNQIKRLNL